MNKSGKTTHGASRSHTYLCVWKPMISRCENPNSNSYRHYGARGIKVCSRWKDYTNFIADMGEPPKGFVIDRIDVNGDYTPENCRWASLVESNRNKRNNVIIEIAGTKKTLIEWAEEVNLGYQTAYRRYKKGARGADIFVPVGTYIPTGAT